MCKPMFWKCDGVDDCGDKTDEQNCGETLIAKEKILYLTQAAEGVAHNSFMCLKADVQVAKLRARTRSVCQRRSVVMARTTVATGRTNLTVEDVRKCYIESSVCYNPLLDERDETNFLKRLLQPYLHVCKVKNTCLN